VVGSGRKAELPDRLVQDGLAGGIELAKSFQVLRFHLIGIGSALGLTNPSCRLSYHIANAMYSNY